MNFLLRKPILILGLGLSLFFAFNNFLAHSFLSDYSLLGIIALGFLFLSWKKRLQNQNLNLLSSLNEQAIETAKRQLEITINYLEKEAPEEDFTPLKEQIKLVEKARTRTNLHLGIMGNKRVGKTTLYQLLNQENNLENITYLDSPETGLNQDLVVFILNGDLTASEAQKIKDLRAFHQRVVLVLNKQDQYNVEETGEILYKIQNSVSDIIPKEDIISMAAAPHNIKVKKYQKDGTFCEEIEVQKPEIKSLQNRLIDIVNNERDSLILASTWRSYILLQKTAKNQLNNIRKKRSQPIIEQYQWIAATATFANPVSSIDLLATATINGQMLIDLGVIYQQKISIENAQNAAITIGKLMVKLGIVELSTQAISTILKSNAVTYIAGGIVQGISAAYLTRIAGLSLIAYYEEQELSINEGEKLNLERLTNKIKSIFAENQKDNLLQIFVTKTLKNKQLKLTT